MRPGYSTRTEPRDPPELDSRKRPAMPLRYFGSGVFTYVQLKISLHKQLDALGFSGIIQGILK